MKCFKFCVVVLVITSIFSTSNAIGGLGGILGDVGNVGGLTNNLGSVTSGLGGVTNSLSSVTSVATTVIQSVTTTITHFSSITSKVTEVANTVSKLTKTATTATAILANLSTSVTSAFGSITSAAQQATSVLKLDQTVIHSAITKVQTVTQKLVQVAGVSSVTHTIFHAQVVQVITSITELITHSRQLFEQVSSQFGSSSLSVSDYAASVGKLLVTVHTTLKITSVTITSLTAFTQTKTSYSEIFESSLTTLQTLIQSFTTSVTKTEFQIIVKKVIVSLGTILSKFPSSPIGNIGSLANNLPFNSDPNQEDPRVNNNGEQLDPSTGLSFAKRHPPRSTENDPNINNNDLIDPRSSDPNNSGNYSPAAILQQNANQSPGQSGVLYQSPTSYRTLPAAPVNQNIANNPSIRNEVLGDGGGNIGPIQQNANQSPGQSGVLYQSPTQYQPASGGFSQTDPTTNYGNRPQIINNVLNGGGNGGGGGGNFDPIVQNANQSPGQSGVVYQSPTTYQTTPIRWYTTPNSQVYYGNDPRINNNVLGGSNRGPVYQNANQSPGQSGILYQSPTSYQTQVRTLPQDYPNQNQINNEPEPSGTGDFSNDPPSYQTVHPLGGGYDPNLGGQINNREQYLPNGFLTNRGDSLIYQYIATLRAVVHKITNVVVSLRQIDTQRIIINIERVTSSIQTLIIFIQGDYALRNNSQIIYGGLQQISLNIQELVIVIQKVIQTQSLNSQTILRLESALKITSAISALTVIGVKELVTLYNSHSTSQENIRISKSLLLRRLINSYQRVFSNDYKGKLNEPNGLNSYATSINGLNNSYSPIYHGISQNAVEVMHGIINSSRQQLREVIISNQQSSHNVVLHHIYQRLGLVNEILEHYQKYGHKGNFDNYISLAHNSAKHKTSYSDVVSYSHNLSRNIVEHSGIPSITNAP